MHMNCISRGSGTGEVGEAVASSNFRALPDGFGHFCLKMSHPIEIFYILLKQEMHGAQVHVKLSQKKSASKFTYIGRFAWTFFWPK